jgi:hypothetical protein
LKLYNNIFLLESDGSVAIESSSTQFQSDHNIYWPERGNFFKIKNNSYNSLEEVQNYTILEDNSIQQDPEFVNKNELNFHLKPSSPAIDKGLSVGLAFDMFGMAIPYGDAPDIGVFEATVDISINESIIADQETQIGVFPNPVKDLLKLKPYSSSLGECKIKIYDLFGRLYFEKDPIVGYDSQQLIEIDVSGLDKGMYVIYIIEGKNIISQKFIKL